MSEKLRYLGPERTSRDTIDQLINQLSLKTLENIEISGLKNIPKTGSFVLGFLPHSGFMEVPAIDEAIRPIRPPPVWITKEENTKGIPSAIRGNRRLLFINRDSPGPQTIKTALAILAQTQGIIASSWEGTRFGRKTEDPDDILTLAPAKDGLTLITTKAGVPIITAVVLGADQVLPRLDKIYAQGGKWAVVKALYQALNRKDKPSLTVDFLPPYTDHILPEGTTLIGPQERAHYAHHTQQIMKTQAIPAILKRNPNYPLGPYANP